MPQLPQCKQPEPVVNSIFQNILFIIIHIFKVLYLFTVGAIIFLFVLIATECLFTGKDFFKLFR
jgi:hypothetical protein